MERQGGKRRRKRRDCKCNICYSVHAHSLRRGKVFFNNLLPRSSVLGMLPLTPCENKGGCGIPGKKTGSTASPVPDSALAWKAGMMFLPRSRFCMLLSGTYWTPGECCALAPVRPKPACSHQVLAQLPHLFLQII